MAGVGWVLLLCWLHLPLSGGSRLVWQTSVVDGLQKLPRRVLLGVFLSICLLPLLAVDLPAWQAALGWGVCWQAAHTAASSHTVSIPRAGLLAPEANWSWCGWWLVQGCCFGLGFTAWVRCNGCSSSRAMYGFKAVSHAPLCAFRAVWSVCPCVAAVSALPIGWLTLWCLLHLALRPDATVLEQLLVCGVCRGPQCILPSCCLCHVSAASVLLAKASGGGVGCASCNCRGRLVTVRCLSWRHGCGFCRCSRFRTPPQS